MENNNSIVVMLALKDLSPYVREIDKEEFTGQMIGSLGWLKYSRHVHILHALLAQLEKEKLKSSAQIFLIHL